MKTLLLPALICLILTDAFTKETAPVRFASLSDATSFLDRALDGDDNAAILKALEPSGDTHFSKAPLAFETLTKERKRTGALTKLYADRKFPTDSKSFKLGGHDSELGHVHIDFVREGSEWKLKDIWVCR